MDVVSRVVVAAVAAASMGAAAQAGDIASTHPWEYLGVETAFLESIAVSPGDGRIAAQIEYGTGLSLFRNWTTPGLGQDWSHVEGMAYPFTGGVVFDDQGVAIFGDQGGLLMAHPGWSSFEDFPEFDAPVTHLASLPEGSLLAAIGEWGPGTPPLRIARLTLAPNTFTDLTPSTLPANHRAVSVLEVCEVTGRVVLVTDELKSGASFTPHMWVSDNGGQEWTERSPMAWPASDLEALAIVGGVLVAAFDGNWGARGVHTSHDGGVSWQASSSEAVRPMQLAADPLREGRVWLGAENGLFVSEDSGLHWTLVHTLDDPMIVSALAVHQPDGRPIVSTWRQGTRVFDPTDGQMHAVGARLGAVQLRDIAVNPLDDNTVSALAWTYPASFETGDAGQSWAQDPGFWGNAANRLLYTMQGRLLAAGHRSDGALLARDPGEWWTTLMPLPAGATNFTMHDVATSTDGTEIMATARMRIAGAPQSRVMRSVDGGHTWDISLELPEPSAQMRLVPRRFDSDRPVLLADLPEFGPQARLFVHDPDIGTWSPGGHQLPPELEGVKVCMADGALQLGTAWAVGSVGETVHVYRSRDHGHSFQPVTSIAGERLPRALWCHPDNPDIAVVSALFGSVVLVDARDGSTRQFGEVIRDHASSARAFDADAEGRLYAATAVGVWRTTLPEVHAFRPHDVAATTHGRRMRPDVTVTWSGGTSEVSVLRGDTVVYSGPNTGQFIERLAPGQRLPAYRVCNVGYEWVCSD